MMQGFVCSRLCYIQEIDEFDLFLAFEFLHLVYSLSFSFFFLLLRSVCLLGVSQVLFQFYFFYVFMIPSNMSMLLEMTCNFKFQISVKLIYITLYLQNHSL